MVKRILKFNDKAESSLNEYFCLPEQRPPNMVPIEVKPLKKDIKPTLLETLLWRCHTVELLDSFLTRVECNQTTYGRHY